MKNHSLIAIMFLFLVLSGCRKEENWEYTISGRLYQDCDMAPVNGVHIGFSNSYNNLWGYNYKKIGRATTTSTGYFSFTYSTVHVKGGEIILNANGYQIKGIPISKDIEIDIVIDEEAPLLVYLQSDSTYSPTDTLFYIARVPKLEVKSIIGPFTNGPIDTIYMNTLFLGAERYDRRYQIGLYGTSLMWGLGYKDFKKANDSGHSGETRYNWIEFTPKGCNDPVTVTIVLD